MHTFADWPGVDRRRAARRVARCAAPRRRRRLRARGNSALAMGDPGGRSATRVGAVRDVLRPRWSAGRWSQVGAAPTSSTGCAPSAGRPLGAGDSTSRARVGAQARRCASLRRARPGRREPGRRVVAGRRPDHRRAADGAATGQGVAGTATGSASHALDVDAGAPAAGPGHATSMAELLDWGASRGATDGVAARGERQRRGAGALRAAGLRHPPPQPLPTSAR